MKNYLVIIGFMGIYVATIDCMHPLAIPEEIRAQMREIKNECLVDLPNIDQDHLALFNSREYVDGDKDLKKLVFCIYRKTNMQNEDGSYNVKGMKARLDLVLPKSYKSFIDNYVEACTKEDHHDALENAWAFLKCMKAKMSQ